MRTARRIIALCALLAALGACGGDAATQPVELLPEAGQAQKPAPDLPEPSARPTLPEPTPTPSTVAP